MPSLVDTSIFIYMTKQESVELTVVTPERIMVNVFVDKMEIEMLQESLAEATHENTLIILRFCDDCGMPTRSLPCKHIFFTVPKWNPYLNMN